MSKIDIRIKKNKLDDHINELLDKAKFRTVHSYGGIDFVTSLIEAAVLVCSGVYIHTYGWEDIVQIIIVNFFSLLLYILRTIVIEINNIHHNFILSKQYEILILKQATELAEALYEDHSAKMDEITDILAEIKNKKGMD